jgi:hypothetical protein
MPVEPDVHILRALPQIEQIRSAWESWPGYRDSDIDFFSAVVSSNPETQRPHVIVAYRDGHPDAILIGRIDLTTVPLRIAYWSLPAPRVRLLTFVIGAQRGNSSPDVSELLFREALRSLRRGEADLGRLESVRVDSSLYSLARRLPGILGRDHGPVSGGHWVMELQKSYEEVLKGLSHELRKELRRTTKRIQADFERVEVKCFERADEIESMLRDMECIAAKSYQRKIGVGFRDTAVLRQHTLLQARKGWLRGYILYVGAKPIAFSLGCLYDGVFYSDDMAFDPDFTKCSPGTVLQARVLEDLCARQAKGIDFGPGDALYKARFGTSRHEEAYLYFYPPTFRGVAHNLVRTLTGLVNSSAKAVLGRAGVLPRIKRVLRGKKGVTAKQQPSTTSPATQGGVNKLTEERSVVKDRGVRNG